MPGMYYKINIDIWKFVFSNNIILFKKKDFSCIFHIGGAYSILELILSPAKFVINEL